MGPGRVALSVLGDDHSCVVTLKANLGIDDGESKKTVALQNTSRSIMKLQLMHPQATLIHRRDDGPQGNILTKIALYAVATLEQR